MYKCVRGIDFVDFPDGSLNCSDIVVFLVFHFKTIYI